MRGRRGGDLSADPAEPFLDPFFDLEDDAVIVYVTRKNAEATLSRLRSENPGAAVSLIGFSDPDELRSYELLYMPSRAERN